MVLDGRMNESTKNQQTGAALSSTSESFVGEWLLADSDSGETVLTFASFIEAAVKRSGSVAYEPIEKGSFASYNKTTDPLNCIVTLAITGTKADIQNALDTLDELQKNTIVSIDWNGCNLTGKL